MVCSYPYPKTFFSFYREIANTKSSQEVLLDLASKIDTNQRCRFNINRSAVLDGAVRGFKRLSYNPASQMFVKFSDDLGIDEEAVDLGGPRRIFKTRYGSIGTVTNI